MYNLLSDYGLVYGRISASEKDLPVYLWVSIAVEAISDCCSKNLRNTDYEKSQKNATFHHCVYTFIFISASLCYLHGQSQNRS